ncbi:MAG TPA: TonB-dependent receptor [Gemmatimonadaceae bacterium]|nr:TonB-dependent receptor [Gemmatimonadaceae bacterium]
MRALLAIAACGAALVTASAVAAQEPAPRDSVARDSAAARARRDTAATRLPTVSVLASIVPSMGPSIGSTVPARVVTISGEMLDAWEPRILSDALAAQPGVSLYDDVGSPLKTTLVTRGFTASPVVGLPQGVSVFLDGVPVNEPDAGQVNFDLLPTEHVERVEFLSGTASLLGPNSLGGAVNLITRRGEGRPSGEAELSGGSYGVASAEGAAGGARGPWSWYAGAGYDRERGWRQATGARTSNVFLNLDHTGARAGAGLQLFGAKSYAETAGSLPEQLFDAKPDSNFTVGDFEDLDQIHLAAHGWAAIGRGRASARLWFRRHTAERFNVNQIEDPDVRSFSNNRTLGAAADWRLTTLFGPGALGLRVGAGGSASDTKVRLYAERIDPGLTTDVESPIRKLDAYAIADWTVGRVTLSGGLRYDLVRIPFRNRLDASRDTTSTFTRASPRAGASVRLWRGASAYASVGRSFRAPALIELACADPNEPCPLPFALGDDPPLAPVVATTYESGVQWAPGRALLEASAYRTGVRDEIFLFPYGDASHPQGSSIDGYFANIPHTRREGVELSGRLSLPGDHVLYANYAWTRATFQSAVELFSIRESAGGTNDVEPGDRFPLVPDQTLAAGATFALPRALVLGLNTRYVGRRWLRGDEANVERPLGGYAVTAVRLGWTAAGWEAQAIVRNVLDRHYATFGTFNINQSTETLDRFLTPGQPRRVQLVLRREF